MKYRLDKKDKELYLRVDEVLHYIWDPIGVSNMPMARDEYDSYVPQVFSLVRDESDADIIARHLLDIVVTRMGLQETMEHALEVADILQDWKTVLDEKYD